jgi:hypothetical protein
MISKTKLLAAALVLAVPFATTACAPDTEKVERWATTENTNVKIDWDKVNQAYKDASGPEDLEKRINEIYEGDEIISIAVKDESDKTQVVTGFFDHNTNGTVDEPEKVFTIRREITGEGAAQYATQGHGHYGMYHSPMMSIASGMLMGAMLSSALSPRYVPVYTQPYTTDSARRGELRNQRSSYRAQNPGKYSRPAPSKSGRSYGGGGGGRRGGGRFGIRRAPGAPRPVRLTA